MNSICSIVFVALLSACAHAQNPLPVEIEETLFNINIPRPKPADYGVDVPQGRSNCAGVADATLKKEFIELSGRYHDRFEIVRNNTDAIFERIDYCKAQQNSEIYLNLRTAILSGVFTDKSILLSVPWAQQQQCLKAMDEEVRLCAGYRQQICEYVRPMNRKAPKFSTQLVRELLQKSDALIFTKDTCLAMGEIVRDPAALEAAAPVDHDAKAIVFNGLSVPFLDELSAAAADGTLDNGFNLNLRERAQRANRARWARL